MHRVHHVFLRPYYADNLPAVKMKIYTVASTWPVTNNLSQWGLMEINTLKNAIGIRVLSRRCLYSFLVTLFRPAGVVRENDPEEKYHCTVYGRRDGEKSPVGPVSPSADVRSYPPAGPTRGSGSQGCSPRARASASMYIV